MTITMETLRSKTDEMSCGRCLAGISGGADSTAMLILLAEERKNKKVFPEAVHVNHGLRGDESDGDEAFCRKLCDELHVPLHVMRVELNGKNDENACREARFQCFREVMDRTGIRNLVLAHNRDDLAETFLMRLLRGAGTEGISCMSGKDERAEYTIYRPLLKAGRDEIRQALLQEGINWREDSLNSSDRYLRNKVRHQLIPLMEEMSSGAVGRIARTAEIITGENRVLQEYAQQFLNEYSSARRIDTRALKSLPESFRNRILRAWWKENTPEREEHTLNARQTDELSALVSASRGKVNLPGGLFAVKGHDSLYLTGFQKEIAEEVYLSQTIPGEIVFMEVRLLTVSSEGNPGNGTTEQEVPEDYFNGCVIRTRRKGDRIRPFGMTGSRKLQDYLTDKRIDEPLRDEIPLICRGNEVLWAAGIGTGAIPRWDSGKRNIRLKWMGDMPWVSAERKEMKDGAKCGAL